MVIVGTFANPVKKKGGQPKSYHGRGDSHKVLHLGKELLAIVGFGERKNQFT